MVLKLFHATSEPPSPALSLVGGFLRSPATANIHFPVRPSVRIRRAESAGVSGTLMALSRFRRRSHITVAPSAAASASALIRGVQSLCV